MENGLIGASVRRVEDPVLMTGAGLYVDDVQPDGALHLAFVRSPHPKARILSVDTSTASSMPGVRLVLTGADTGALGVPTPPLVPGMRIPPHPVLAQGSVHAVGAPVAAVVADTRAAAEDAAGSIEVEYDPQPSVSDAQDALAPNAPLVHDDLDSNVCYAVTREGGDVERAFAEADHVTRLHIASPRLASVALEPRGVVAIPEARGQGLTVWVSVQGAHRIRADLAVALGFPEHQIRLIAPDVGGGFGTKGPLYREYVLAGYVA
ncbi:MAG: xanthine dehydrogenase family protein molybdopterin-binding subunit, partial [Chloroflexota bacterium]|nr:xanthine dehydrogenase family protein molybdopterin-binding subunit [Chloroflexota bacterium]